MTEVLVMDGPVLDTVFQKSTHPSSRHCNLFATQVNDSVEGHARQL